MRLLGLMLAATFLVSGCGPSPVEKAAAEAAAKKAATDAALAAQAEAEKVRDLKFIEVMKDDVRDDFRDPDTARFRRLAYSTKRLSTGGTQYELCGEVNATNEYGGYVGYRQFATLMQLKPSDELVVVGTLMDDRFINVDPSDCQNAKPVPQR
jgi:hypothetical protein